MELTKELLHELFEYRDGNLYRKVATCNKIKIGQPSSGFNNEGYSHTRVLGKKQKTHRLIFLMHHGYLPTTIDHINGDRSDNHIENLRDVSRSGNAQNAKLRTDNTSGVKGVFWNKQCKKWSVSVQVNKKPKYCGLYDDLELAELVAIEARNKYHGEFANHG